LNEKIENKKPNKVQSRKESKSMGPPIKKSKSLKALSKKVNVNVPCPYPPRIQRQWEAHNKKKWYGLSLDSKKRAETSMKELVLQNK
jgi:hypothetical protein